MAFDPKKLQPIPPKAGVVYKALFDADQAAVAETDIWRHEHMHAIALFLAKYISRMKPEVQDDSIDWIAETAKEQVRVIAFMESGPKTKQ